MEEEIKDNETAESHYKKCLEIDDRYCSAYHNYAVLLHKQKELNKARKYYEKSLSFNNKCILTHRNFALLLVALKCDNLAYHHLEIALDLSLRKRDSIVSWNQTIDAIDSVDLNSSEATDCRKMMQHILQENQVFMIYKSLCISEQMSQYL